MKQALSLLALLLFLILPAPAQDDEYYHPELNWRTIETDHFFVHYHDGTARTAHTVAKIAEEIYGPVTSLYHHEPDSKVSFVIKDYDDYSNGAAYFFDNKIEIWASALDFDLRGTHNWLRNVVTHEFTHIVQIQTSLKFGRRVPAIYFQWLQYESERRTDVLYGYPNGIVSYPISGYVVPSWFAEGVAQFNRRELGYDSWDSFRDMILRMYSLDNNMLTWNEMSVFGKTSLGNESSYNAGFAFVRYISDKYGDDKLEQISRNLASVTALTIDGAIEGAVGKSGGQVYDEWREHLRTTYAERVAGIRSTLAEGEIFGKVGFGNFYPTFSPDGRTIAYVSNKEADYFGLSSIYLYDVASKKEKMLKAGVRSTLGWSPDGKKIYYAKTTRSNDHWSNLSDVYVYDIDREEETRLTHGVRANSPSVSPDGSTIAFVAGGDGTINLFAMHSDGSAITQLTHYAEGEQVFNPKWSPDGSTIIFDYSIRDGRDIVAIPAAGGEVRTILATPDDERNAVYSADGSALYYSSDKTGIFNIYRLDLKSNETTQLTNVLGGAFMPSVNAAGELAFATYTSTGYKAASLEAPKPLLQPLAYQKSEADPAGIAAPPIAAQGNFDWKKLRAYDDSQLPPENDTTYRTVATSLSIIPFLRVDNYNPKNKGIDIIKPGLYAYSYDVLDRFGFLAGAAMNKRFERDLFFNFDYRGRIPGLYQLGLEPTFSIEAYNISRKTDTPVKLRTDLVINGVEVTYNLLELDAVLRQRIIPEALDLEVRYAHSWYNADLGAFVFKDNYPGAPVIVSQAFGTQYLNGNDLSATFKFTTIALSRTRDINPVGRKIKIRYDYEFDKFNPDDEYEINSAGLLVPKYQNIRFHRLEIGWKEMEKLPGWSHTLTADLRGGTIFGPPVHHFYDFYIGGLAGMRGYPFYSLGGNEYAFANLTYRFPLIEHIDLRMLQIYFDKMYLAFYGDAGTVWSGGALHDQKVKYDAGTELRIESFSYYAFPTRIFVSATYGFNQFHAEANPVPTYGKEWNFHFGVLFGFDLD